MADEIRMSDITFSDPSSYDGGLTNLSHKKDDYLSPQQAIQSSSSTPGKSGNKIGHRRIDKQGEVSYKRVPTNALMGAIQLGIANSVGSLAGKPRRDILVQDFEVIESVTFPTFVFLIFLIVWVRNRFFYQVFRFLRKKWSKTKL